MYKWLLRFLFFFVIGSYASSLHAQVGPLPCGAVSSVTTWRNDFAYSIGQVVIFDGVTYQSTVNNNINLNPCTYSGSQWNNVLSGGGGGGSPTGPAGGILGGTYPNPGLATSGAIPNGWTATTQTTGDNTTKVATDAFVIANSGGSGGLPTASSTNQVPAATAPGTSYAAQYVGGIGVVLADGLTGANCGAKINTALGIIGSNPGNVEITPACGAITTAVSFGTNQHLYARPGSYSVGATVTLSGNNSTVYCDPSSDAPDVGYGSCLFTQANTANLASIFTLSGTNTGLDNVSINGNGANNTTSGPNVLVTGLRARLSYLTSQGSHSHGITIGNGTSNVAAAPKINHSMILGNTGDGIHCVVTSDLFVSDQTEIENNGGNGITLTNCGGARILSANDISGNGLDGVQINGTSIAAVSSFNNTISGNYLASNGHNDVEIDGWDSVNLSYASTSNIVSDNIFQGSQNHGNNQYSAIYIYTSGYNVVSGNVIQDPFGSSFKFLAGVNIVQGGGLFEQADTVVGNTITVLGIPIIGVSTTVQGTNAVNDQPGPVTGALNLSPTMQSTSITGFSQGTGINQGSFALNFYNPTTATSSFSYPAPAIGDCANYYQASTSNLLCVVNQLYYSPNSGSSPAGFYQFALSGSAPAAGFTYQFIGGPVSAQVEASSGSTAVTPASNDNSTKIATTAYVQANIGAPLNSPAFTGTPTAPTATGGTDTTQIATTQFGFNNFLYQGGNYNSQQFTQTPIYTPSVGTVLQVDGFPSAGGSFAGTWSSSTAYNRFQTVTYLGTTWIAINGSTNVTPAAGAAGSAQFWAPCSVTGGMAATQADAAFYWAWGQVQLNATGFGAYSSVSLLFGNRLGGYNKNCDWVMPTNSTGYSMSLIGQGRGETWIHQTTSTLNYMVSSPNVSSSGGQTIQGITLDANILAGGCLSHHLRRSLINDISCWNPQQQSTGTIGAAMWLGSGADAYETKYEHLLVRTPSYSGLVAAYGTATVTSGAISAVTWTGTGTSLDLPVTAGPGLVAYFLGKGASGTSYKPCGTMPVVSAIALTGGSINTGTGIGGFTFSSAGATCGGTIYVRVQQAGTLNQGYYLNGSDTTVDDIVTSGDFTQECEYVNGPAVLYHEHPYCAAPYQIETTGSGFRVHNALQMDSPIQYGIYMGGTGGTSIQGVNEEYNAGHQFGAGGFLIDGASGPISIIDAGCYLGSPQNFGGYAKYTGTSLGPLTPASTLPSNTYISGIQPNCDGSSTFWGNVTNSLTVSGSGPGIITMSPFSAAGTALPTCSSTNVNSEAVVSDQTGAPTYYGAYTSGGAYTAPVICRYDGSAYAWVTY